MMARADGACANVFPLGLEFKHMIFMLEMVSLVQCFYFGMLITFMLPQVAKGWGAAGVFAYIFLTIPVQFFVVFYSSPTTMNNFTLIQASLGRSAETMEMIFEVEEETFELSENSREIADGLEERIKKLKLEIDFSDMDNCRKVVKN